MVSPSLIPNLSTRDSWYSKMEYVYMPSKPEKGPLQPRDVEQARMPCFLGMDYPDDGTSYTAIYNTTIDLTK